MIPDGYANYSAIRKIYNKEYLMNRKYVSVSIGSEYNFVIKSATEYEQKLNEN